MSLKLFGFCEYEYTVAPYFGKAELPDHRLLLVISGL
jgi:hypothetical protein